MASSIREPRGRGRAPALAVAAALLAGACWAKRAPRPPPPPRLSSIPVPGTLWVTPAQPWRTPHASHFAIAGDMALLGAYSDWIVRFDLRRGAPVHERRLEGVSIDQLVTLPDGRWLLVGERGGRTIAAVIDAATLEPKVVVTGPERAAGDSRRVSNRAVVLDEGIAIGGEGLPLAIYDPATWQVRRVLAPELGWSQAAGGGKALYAIRDGEIFRFDLAASGAGAPVKLARAARYFGATPTHLVTRVPRDGKDGYEAAAAGVKAWIPGSDPSAALDPVRGRIAVREGTAVHVHALADGRRLGSYELGPSAHGSHRMAFGGDRLFVAIGSVLRAIDLTTGAITPAGDPPYAGACSP